MRCPKCGTDNSPGRILCTKCGTRLRAAAVLGGAALASAEGQATLMRHLRRDLRRLAIVVAVVVAVSVSLGLLFR